MTKRKKRTKNRPKKGTDHSLRATNTSQRATVKDSQRTKNGVFMIKPILSYLPVRLTRPCPIHPYSHVRHFSLTMGQNARCLSLTSDSPTGQTQLTHTRIPNLTTAILLSVEDRRESSDVQVSMTILVLS